MTTIETLSKVKFKSGRWQSKSQRFNEDSKLNQTPGPKYDVNDKYTNSGFNAYSGYVAMARPKSDSREYSKGLPGPGAYDTVKQPFHNVQSSNFRKMAGRDDIVNTKQNGWVKHQLHMIIMWSNQSLHYGH